MRRPGSLYSKNTLISTVACTVTVQGVLLHVSCQRTWPGARRPGSLHRQRPSATLLGFPSHLISGVLVHVLHGRHGQACAILALVLLMIVDLTLMR